MSGKFVLASISDNNQGWGPLGSIEKFQEVPFSWFNKGEKLGHVSDWNVETKYNNSQSRQDRTQANRQVDAKIAQDADYIAPVNALTFQPEDDEASFSLVDNKPKPKTKRKPFRPTNFRPNTSRGGFNAPNRQNPRPNTSASAVLNARNTQGANSRQPAAPVRPKKAPLSAQQQEIKDATLRPEESWEKLGEYELSVLKTQKGEEPSAVSDLYKAGVLYEYKKSVEQLAPNNAIRLKPSDKTFYSVTASEDPILQKFSAENQANVFVTDVILALLMTAPRSIYSWDIVVRKDGDKIYLDKRPDSRVDFWTVNENWSELQADYRDPLNHPFNLATEATLINRNFSQECISEKQKHEFEHPNPFVSSENQNEAAAVGYRYRKFTLGDNVELAVRCEVNSFISNKDGSVSYVSLKALNEYDPKASGSVSWRGNLGAQPSAVLTVEMKHNNSKLSRWTTQALLAGVDLLRFGFVTRVNTRDTNQHQLVKVIPYNASKFAELLFLSTENMWGIVQYLISEFRKLPDGKYALLKEPKESKLKLYRVPQQPVQPQPQE